MDRESVEGQGRFETLFETLESRLSGLPLLIVWVVLIHLVALVYRPAMHGPFLFDGRHAIVQNEDLRHPQEPWRLLGDHEDSLTFDRRPVTGLSFLLNFQLSGLRPYHYRLVNIVLHLLAGFALFSVVAHLARHFGCATPRLLALCLSSLWLLHPIGTSAVSYIYQRSEVLMSLFFLLSVLALLKAGKAPEGQGQWLAASGLAALGSALSKEVGIVTLLGLPVVDRVCHFDSWRALVAKRWPFYLLLAASMAGLAAWFLTGVRTQDLGAGGELATPWDYFKTQCGVLLRYLRLVFWPAPLIFYGSPGVAATLWEWLPHALTLSILVSYGLWRGIRHRWLLLPVTLFLLILAPTSSFVPIPTEPEVDFRMYLPSALVLSVLIPSLFGLLARRRNLQLFGLITILAWILAFGASSFVRNHDYSSSRRLWASVVRHDPDNVVALGSLAMSSMVAGDLKTARDCGERLLRLGQRGSPQPAAEVGRRIVALVDAEEGKNAEQAAATLLEMRARNPALSEIDVHCAFALVRAGRADAAALLLESMPPLARVQPHVRRIEAEVALARKDYALAKSILKDFQAQAPRAWLTRQLEARIDNSLRESEEKGVGTQ